jgi:hypothetical protein
VNEKPYSVIPGDGRGYYAIARDGKKITHGEFINATAETHCRLLNSAFALGAASAGGEVERVARKFIADVDALRERFNREGPALGAQRCTIILIDDACEGINAIRTALSPLTSAAKEKPNE